MLKRLKNWFNRWRVERDLLIEEDRDLEIELEVLRHRFKDAVEDARIEKEEAANAQGY